ncbi:MAG: prolipoprotein diacylglyceryl transferase, partial [Granulosicoccaceae bacterium]
MLTYPNIDPVAFRVFDWPIHWYGITYLVGFLGGWWLGRVRAASAGWTREQVGDIVFYAAIGVILGGRLGYLLFYAPFLPEAERAPFWAIWKGGMSFHGGLVGVIVAMWLFGLVSKKGFWAVADFIAPLTPIGLGA